MERLGDDALPQRSSQPPTPDPENAPPQTRVQGYIAIRPKPPDPPKPPRQPTAATAKPQLLKVPVPPARRRCPVPICKRPDCRLQTHKNYGKYRVLATKYGGTGSKASENIPSPLPLTEHVSGLPELPLGEGQPGVYRTLFHDFFSKTYDRITVLLSPPPLSVEQEIKAALHKKAMLHRALQTPVYCLNYVASAFVAQPRPSHHHDSMMLYSKVMKLLREKLANFAPEEVDNLLVVVLTLVLLDIAVQNYSHLEVHRAGMALLVNSRGGLHNLDTSLMYTVTLDRIIAMYISKPPLYVSRLDRALQRPVRFKHQYGMFFESPTAQAVELPKEICDYCQDICRTIELFEGQEVTFHSSFSELIANKPADTHYFYFLKHRIANEFTFLNAEYAEDYGRVKCFLLAARIVDYLVLHDNYIVVIPVFLATKIRECLEKQNLEEEWTGLEAALRWVQWTMACVLKFSDDAAHQQEAMRFLVDRSEEMYKKLPFPLDWNEQGLQFSCVRNFVWANSLDERLAQVCEDEDAMLRERLVKMEHSSSRTTVQAGPADKKGKRKAKRH